MAREAVYIRIILEEMGHRQPPTPLQTDNSMAEAVVNGKIQPKWTKATDMRFHWLRDRECKEEFRITLQHNQQLLDYIATQEEDVLKFNASDTKLAAHSDTSYLSETKACSRAGGHFPLSSDSTIPQNKGAVLNIAHIIKHVMSSATEA